MKMKVKLIGVLATSIMTLGIFSSTALASTTQPLTTTGTQQSIQPNTTITGGGSWPANTSVNLQYFSPQYYLQAFAVKVTISNPDGMDSAKVTIDWGDGSQESTKSWSTWATTDSVILSHFYALPGDYTFKVTEDVTSLGVEGSETQDELAVMTAS